MTDASRPDETADEPRLPTDPPPWIDRELSWLAFNARVLQEAADPEVPLFERFGFLGIFSSNLDEFFRVRVASLRTLLRLRKKQARRLGVRPARLLREIHREVVAQQERFGTLFREELLPALEAEGIALIRDPERHPEILPALEGRFEEKVRPVLELRDLPDPDDPSEADGDAPFLEDRTSYLAVELWPRDDRREGVDYSLVRIPSPPLRRFVPVHLDDGRQGIVFLDDVIRLHLPRLFPDHEVGGAYAVKLSRDADLRIDDEYGVELVEAIRRSLSKRSTGIPSRFLYDGHAPWPLVTALRDRLGLADEDLVLGGRYHNLHDLRTLPRFRRADLGWPDWPPLPHPTLSGSGSLLDAVAEVDRLLHFPYHDFGLVSRFVAEAATDPAVEEIHLTVYRVASDSEILSALVRAAEAGKAVHAFFEVQARFDEASNLRWARRLEEAGARVDYSIPGLKVHAKVALVIRREAGGRRRYGYLGTGNFNEVTSRFYTDLGLLTAHPGIGADLETLFHHLRGEVEAPDFDHLLVAPFRLRSALEEKVAAEAEAAGRGAPSGIEFKLNALEDPGMGVALRDASQAGVPMRGIVRGICCLAPGVAGETETLEIRSIVDRYLEHTRIYRFHAGGDDEIWLASADWMTRNLDRRIEVAFPVLDRRLADRVRRVLELQFADDRKARLIDSELRNVYASPREHASVRAQAAEREWLRELGATRTPVTDDPSSSPSAQ